MTREEAIKELRGFIGQLTEGCQEAIKVLIPELAESEDERIRKAIIELLKEVGRDDTGISENAKCMIAYLERHKYSPMPEDTVIFQKGVAEGRRLEREEQKPTPDWMPKFLDELRSKKHYFDWDEHRDIEGHILAIIKWIAPDYFNRKEKGQKPLPGFDDLTPDEKMNHPLYLEGFDTGREVGRVEAEQRPEWSEEDEKMVETICKEGDLKPSEQRWLRSLKNRGNFPKSNTNSPSWKPSASQLMALDGVKRRMSLEGYGLCPDLQSLLDDLKKLM